MGPGASHHMDLIDILLATYNGAAYLEEQLESIAAQTHERWCLIVRDDGSTDESPQIIESFRARYPDSVVVLHDEDGNLGYVGNFSRLMENSTAPYAAFCDQDDIWIPEKLELSLARMHEMERRHGADTPLLVFTDLTVVDQKLRILHPSYWRRYKLRPERSASLNRLLLQNPVAGCTTLINRPLLGLTAPIPSDAHVHDWWVVLSAAAFGAVDGITRSTVLYRQHSGNAIGAAGHRLRVFPLRFDRFAEAVRVARVSTAKKLSRGRVFLAHFGERLSNSQIQILRAFLCFPESSLLRRVMILISYRLAPTGLWRSCLFVLASLGPPDRR